MAIYPELTIRFPPSLMLDVRVVSEREGQSVDNFVLQAVAEKVSALRARGLADPLSPEEQLAYLQYRAARARPGGLKELLERVGTDEVIPGDELPEDWPNTPAEAGVER